MIHDGRLLIGNVTKYLFSKTDASDIWFAVRNCCRQFVGKARVKLKDGHFLDTCDQVEGSSEHRS